MTTMAFQPRSLSPQESRVVLALSERSLRAVARKDIVELLGARLKAVDNIIESLRRKGWLERANWANICSSLPTKDLRLSATAVCWRKPVSSRSPIPLATAPTPLALGSGSRRSCRTEMHPLCGSVTASFLRLNSLTRRRPEPEVQ